MIQFILYSIGVFLTIILLLVVILLIAKKYLSPSGNVNIEINGDKTISVAQGSSLMTTLNENGIFLPSACGGKASCGQCKVQVLDGGGEILDSEKPHFTRKEIKDNWRLGCQCKVKGDMKIKVPESVMGVKEWECTVISNKNVSSFIKEFIVALPPGEHMDFIPHILTEGTQSGRYNTRLLYGKLSCRRRPHNFDSTYCDNTIQATSRSRFPRCSDRYRFKLYLLSQARRQSNNERTIRRLPPYLRLKERNDMGRRWCRHGAFTCTDNAHDKNATVPRP